MRLACLLLACSALAACAGTVPEALPPPAPVVVRPAPPPEPVPPPVVVVPEAPPALPPTPRGAVSTRAYYEPVDVTEIVLSNGATVVVKPLQAPVQLLALDCRVRALASTATAADGNLEPLLRESGIEPSPSAVYVVTGDVSPQAAEFAAAQALVFATVPPARYDGIRAVAPHTYRLASDDAAVADVLVEVANGRAQPRLTSIYRDACAGTPIFETSLDAAALARLRPTPDEVAAARARVLATADSPQRWNKALAALYAPPGGLRPSQPPNVLASFSNRVARVSAQDVERLAQRLADSN